MTDEVQDCTGRQLKPGDWVTIQPVPGGYRQTYDLDEARENVAGARFQVTALEQRKGGLDWFHYWVYGVSVGGYNRWPSVVVKADAQGLKELATRYRTGR